MYSNIVKTYEVLLTYDLRIRNTDPRFHLVSCYKKHFRSQMKNAVSYMRVVTYFNLSIDSFLFLERVLFRREALKCQGKNRDSSINAQKIGKDYLKK